MSAMQISQRRSGVIAKKIGMTRVFHDDGRHVPVTVLKVESCQVVAQRRIETHGYTAVQVGHGAAKVKNINAALRGNFTKAQIEPKKVLKEFRVSEDGLIDVGREILADHFISGQFVDVVGTSIGKGFAGGMKRHNFSGLRASHGVSVSHRAIGSTGQCQDPGKVFKGKKMPGQMGAVTATVQNLEVVSTDANRGLIFVEGGVPGPKSGIVFVSDAVKKGFPKDSPFPTSENITKETAPTDSSQEEEQVKEGINEPTNSIEESKIILDGTSEKNIQISDIAATNTEEN